jgi:hypothetical protein
MAVFEVRVNGEHRFRGADVTAITVVLDLLSRSGRERIAMHVASGGPEERTIHHLAADLATGDEVTIRVVDDGELDGVVPRAADGCSFCGSSIHDVHSLVSVERKAICYSCLRSFRAVVLHGATLPVGTTVRDGEGRPSCAFCDRAPPDVPALLVRNDSAICPGCLRSCVDLRDDDG